MIATNVSKVNEWKGCDVWYKINCSCSGGDDCDCNIEFEFDKDFGDVTVNFYKHLMWEDYWQNKWFLPRWWTRVKVAVKVLLTGRTDVNGDFIIQGQDHIESIIEAFQEGRDKMAQWKIDFVDEQEKTKKHNEDIDNES